MDAIAGTEMTDTKTETWCGYADTELALHRMGKGAPLVLLHGLFSDAQMNWIRWGHAEKLAALGYEVFMPDLRAHGQSERPHDPAAYPDDVLALDLLALVDHLGLTEYDLAGFSLGSRTSIRGIAHGATPKRLILGGMGLQGLVGWHERAAQFRDALDRFDTVQQGDKAYYTVQFIKSQKIDRVAARLLIDSIADTDLDRLKTFAMPTLVVCGDEDRDNGDPVALAEALPNAEHREIPGTHMGCVTKPDLGQAMADWLGPA